MEANQSNPGEEENEIIRELAGLVSRSLKQSEHSAAIDELMIDGSWYVVPDESAREIVFDMRALYLGFLVPGLRLSKGAVGNVAQWLLEWLRSRVGAQALSAAFYARADLAVVRRMLDAGFSPVLSRSVRDLEPLASDYAVRTVKRSTYDARHLFAAMLERGAIVDMTTRLFRIALTDDDVLDLKRSLVDRVMRSPEPGETREAWHDVLKLGSPEEPQDEKAPPAPPPTPPPPDDSVSPFSGDTPSADDEKDVLDTKRDVEALAELVRLDGVTPLAIAIFGDWGSGKSTFMARLEKAVRDMPAREAGEVLPLVKESSAARFVHPVVQIRFNAWHFADANLWTSLTAEFFDQLRAGGYDRVGGVRHAKLVEEVNQHVHGLARTASDNREALASNGARVLKAQVAVDKAAKTARGIPGSVLTKTAINLLGETYVARKAQLAALGLTTSGEGQGRAADVVVGAAKDLAGAFGSMRAVLGVLLKTTGWLWVLAGVVLAVATTWGVGAYLRAHAADGSWLKDATPWLAWAIGAAVAFFKAVAPAAAIVRDVARRGAAILGEIDARNQAAAADLLAKDLALKRALKEAVALEEAEAASARALARYVDPKGAANPPRLLRYVLEDDPDTKALEKDIGLIGRTRRLFQAVNDIARAEHDKRRKGEAYDKETPERIVIYIDDLDRCDEAKVYEVLQAVHLLLAFDLFVVVVGVDVKWVQSALARQFETGDAKADAATEQQRNERAMHYLEKIFQIPFWLRPLSGGAGGTFQPYIKMLAGDSVEKTRDEENQAREAWAVAQKARAKQAAEFSVTAVPAPPNGEADVGGDAKDAAAGAANFPSTESEEAKVELVEARRKLQLTEDEIAFLSSPEIAALASTAPRGVKRLVNVYRIARARRGQENRDAVLGADGKSEEYPLIALMTAVETGQSFKVAEWFYDLCELGREEPIISLLADAMKTPRLNSAPVTPEADPDEPPPIEAIQALANACKAAAGLRKGALAADDLLAAARLVRRYSFNRYR
jgi:hypothetical protein